MSCPGLVRGEQRSKERSSSRVGGELALSGAGEQHRDVDEVPAKPAHAVRRTLCGADAKADLHASALHRIA